MPLCALFPLITSPWSQSRGVQRIQGIFSGGGSSAEENCKITYRQGVIFDTIRYIDLFSGIGGFREGLTRAGGFVCAGHCEIDKYAEKSYRTLFDTKGEWFCEDIRKADPNEMPGFDLICGGFPCLFRTAAIAFGHRIRSPFRWSRLFFVSKSTSLHWASILRGSLTGPRKASALRGEEAQGSERSFRLKAETKQSGLCADELNSKDFGVPQSRRRVYLVSQGTLCCVDMNDKPALTDYARCLTARQNGGIRNHKREASGVWDGCRIRRLTPRECLRLQGWTDDRIDLVLPIQSDAQLYKQAGNGVTVNVVEAIGKRLYAAHREVNAVD